MLKNIPSDKVKVLCEKNGKFLPKENCFLSRITQRKKWENSGKFRPQASGKIEAIWGYNYTIFPHKTDILRFVIIYLATFPHRSITAIHCLSTLAFICWKSTENLLWKGQKNPMRSVQKVMWKFSPLCDLIKCETRDN